MLPVATFSRGVGWPPRSICHPLRASTELPPSSDSYPAHTWPDPASTLLLPYSCSAPTLQKPYFISTPGNDQKCIQSTIDFNWLTTRHRDDQAGVPLGKENLPSSNFNWVHYLGPPGPFSFPEYYLNLVIPRFEEPRKKIGGRVRLSHGRISK